MFDLNSGNSNSDPNSSSSLSDLFPYQTNTDLGTLGEASIETDGFLELGVRENNVYQFDVEETSNFNISLENISSGDDADLELYRDSNSNGILDNSDEWLDGSYNGGDYDDVVNYMSAEPGNYFALVSSYDAGSDETISYELNLVAEENANGHIYTHQTNTDLGTLGEASIETDGFLELGVRENNVYQFDVEETSNFNVSFA